MFSTFGLIEQYDSQLPKAIGDGEHNARKQEKVRYY